MSLNAPRKEIDLLNELKETKNYLENCKWNLSQASKACKEYEDTIAKYEENLKLIIDLTKGVNIPIVKDIHRIAIETLKR